MCVCARQGEACARSHLTEQPIANAAGELLSLGNLVGDSFLLIQLLGEHLQLGEGELQGQTVHVALRRVLQHVLAEVTTGRGRLAEGKAETLSSVSAELSVTKYFGQIHRCINTMCACVLVLVHVCQIINTFNCK